jgi:hypothetical protein
LYFLWRCERAKKVGFVAENGSGKNYFITRLALETPDDGRVPSEDLSLAFLTPGTQILIRPNSRNHICWNNERSCGLLSMLKSF